jgi:hypothetical protein
MASIKDAALQYELKRAHSFVLGAGKFSLFAVSHWRLYSADLSLKRGMP